MSIVATLHNGERYRAKCRCGGTAITHFAWHGIREEEIAALEYEA